MSRRKADCHNFGFVHSFDVKLKNRKMVISRRLFVAAIMLISWLSVALQAQEISLDSLPAVVVKTVPQSGDTSVEVDLEEIKVTFSKDMLDRSWSLVQMSKESFPQFTGQPRFLADKRTCVVPVNLESNKTYVIWLNNDRYTNFKDSNQQAAMPYLLMFKTSEN